MPVNSPLSHITDVISHVKASAQNHNHKPLLQSNEAATRAALVDPMLRALGWDISNIDMVVVEQTMDGIIRVDYALYDQYKRVVAVIEAKSLGSPLTHSHILNRLQFYAQTFQLRDIWLTDGLNWHHHSLTQLGEVTPVPLESLSLNSQSAVTVAAYLVEHLDATNFWLPSATINGLSQDLVSLATDLKALQGEYLELARRVKFLEGSYTDLSVFTFQQGMVLEQLRMPDSTIVSVANLSDVLRKCCEYALNTDPNIGLPMVDAAGRTQHLLDFRPPITNANCAKIQHKGQDIYIFLNYAAANYIRNANYILSKVQSTGVNAAIKYH